MVLRQLRRASRNSAGKRADVGGDRIHVIGGNGPVRNLALKGGDLRLEVVDLRGHAADKSDSRFDLGVEIGDLLSCHEVYLPV